LAGIGFFMLLAPASAYFWTASRGPPRICWVDDLSEGDKKLWRRILDSADSQFATRVVAFGGLHKRRGTTAPNRLCQPPGRPSSEGRCPTGGGALIHREGGRPPLGVHYENTWAGVLLEGGGGPLGSVSLSPRNFCTLLILVITKGGGTGRGSWLRKTPPEFEKNGMAFVFRVDFVFGGLEVYRSTRFSVRKPPRPPQGDFFCPTTGHRGSCSFLGSEICYSRFLFVLLRSGPGTGVRARCGLDSLFFGLRGLVGLPPQTCQTGGSVCVIVGRFPLR